MAIEKKADLKDSRLSKSSSIVLNQEGERMNIVNEIQEALVQVQSTLDKGKSLTDKELQLLFLVSLAQEANRGEN